MAEPVMQCELCQAELDEPPHPGPDRQSAASVFACPNCGTYTAYDLILKQIHELGLERQISHAIRRQARRGRAFEIRRLLSTLSKQIRGYPRFTNN